MKKFFLILFIGSFIFSGCTNTRSLKNEINRLKIKNKELERRVSQLEIKLKKRSMEVHEKKVNLNTIVKRTVDLNNRYVELYKAINEVRTKLGLPSLQTPSTAK